jgi:hypothetical protein
MGEGKRKKVKGGGSRGRQDVREMEFRGGMRRSQMEFGNEGEILDRINKINGIFGRFFLSFKSC